MLSEIFSAVVLVVLVYMLFQKDSVIVRNLFKRTR